jgi:hypothetical protein
MVLESKSRLQKVLEWLLPAMHQQDLPPPPPPLRRPLLHPVPLELLRQEQLRMLEQSRLLLPISIWNFTLMVKKSIYRIQSMGLFINIIKVYLLERQLLASLSIWFGKRSMDLLLLVCPYPHGRNGD